MYPQTANIKNSRHGARNSVISCLREVKINGLFNSFKICKNCTISARYEVCGSTIKYAYDAAPGDSWGCRFYIVTIKINKYETGKSFKFDEKVNKV